MKKGFTLIEILIVIAIAVIITSGGFAAYATFSNQQKLQSGTLKIRDYFETAKQKALAGDKNDGAGGDICQDIQLGNFPLLQGYRVTISSSNGVETITITAECSDSGGKNIQYSSPVETDTIDSSLNIQNLPLTVDFATLTGSTTVNGALPVMITNTTGRVRCINISGLGVIEEDENMDCVNN